MLPDQSNAKLQYARRSAALGHYLRGPSDLNDIAAELLRARPLMKPRSVHLASQVLSRMIEIEAALCGAHNSEMPTLPLRANEDLLVSLLDRPIGFWRPGVSDA
jgi:hypothetical protein